MISWKQTTLGESCELYQPKTISSDELVPDGKYPVYGANGIIGKYDQFNHAEAQLLVTCRGATCGSVNISLPNAWINGNAMVVRPKDSSIELDYLKHLFQGGLDLTRVITGAAQPQITRQSLAPVMIRVPPIAEQRRIADILDRADALRAKRRAALDHLDELTQAIFVDMFGDPVSNPKEWPRKPFDEICPTRLGKMLDQKKQSGQHARRYIRNANVQWFRVDVSDVYEMDFDSYDRERFRLHRGDVLICEGGEPGRAAIWQQELPECYYQKAIHRGRPNTNMATAEYLVRMLWFLSRGGDLLDHITSATIAHLTSEKLKAIKVPLPPLSMQNEFSTRLLAINRVHRIHQESTADLGNLFASLQDRAFRGAL